MRIISGGQTGADRAALDVAIAAGIPHGGWVPKHRTAEDGTLPERYGLRETESENVEERTLLNVRDADATLIIARAPLGGGTALTKEYADKFGKPSLVLDPSELSPDNAARELTDWIAVTAINTLNIAGPRASEDPTIYDATRAILQACSYFAHGEH